MSNSAPSADTTYAVGDVIEDAYANPAVVLRLDHRGLPATVMQTCGSDRGRITSADMAILRRFEDPGTIERAREVARAESRRQNLKWGPNGLA